MGYFFLGSARLDLFEQDASWAVLQVIILQIVVVGKVRHRFADARGDLGADRAQAGGISTNRLNLADAPPAVAAAVRRERVGRLIQ